MLIPTHSSQAFFEAFAKARLEGRPVFSIRRPSSKESLGGVLWILDVGEPRLSQPDLLEFSKPSIEGKS